MQAVPVQPQCMLPVNCTLRAKHRVCTKNCDCLPAPPAQIRSWEQATDQRQDSRLLKWQYAAQQQAPAKVLVAADMHEKHFRTLLLTLSFFKSAYLIVSNLSPAAAQTFWFNASRAAVACATAGYVTNMNALRGLCCCSGTTTVAGPNWLNIWLIAARSSPTPVPQLPTNR